jgi:ribosome recycling factor
MLEELYKETHERMKKSVDAVAREFNAVRTGKATVQLLDTVKVEAYGSQLPLNQVATIAAPEPRLLVVQAFEKGTVGEIVKGIQKADLGFNPVVEGQTIRIPVPALNEERRQELARHCRNMAEEGRVAIRKWRYAIFVAMPTTKSRRLRRARRSRRIRRRTDWTKSRK